MKLKNLNIEKVAKAIETDAGRALPGLRKSLRQAKHGEGRVVYGMNCGRTRVLPQSPP